MNGLHHWWRDLRLPIRVSDLCVVETGEILNVTTKWILQIVVYFLIIAL